MTKRQSHAYRPNQTVLFPQRTDEDIAKNAPVVNAIVDSLNQENIKKLYKRTDRCPYHPKMMLKVMNNMRYLIYILMLSICISCTGCSIRTTGSGAGSSVAVALCDSLHSDGGDSIMMELSANRFKMPVDTIISTKIINNTKCSSISLKGKRIVEKKIGGKWIPFQHRIRSKGGALYSTTLKSVNIGSGGSYDINIPLRSESYEKDFSPGEYRLGREIEINGREKRYVYSAFTVY